MKKFIHAVLLVVFLFGGSKLYAQVSPAISTDTSTTEGLLHYILEPIDKSQVPTGFLAAWGAPILPMTTDHLFAACPKKIYIPCSVSSKNMVYMKNTKLL